MGTIRKTLSKVFTNATNTFSVKVLGSPRSLTFRPPSHTTSMTTETTSAVPEHERARSSGHEDLSTSRNGLNLGPAFLFDSLSLADMSGGLHDAIFADVCFGSSLLAGVYLNSVSTFAIHLYVVRDSVLPLAWSSAMS